MADVVFYPDDERGKLDNASVNILKKGVYISAIYQSFTKRSRHTQQVTLVESMQEAPLIEIKIPLF